MCDTYRWMDGASDVRYHFSLACPFLRFSHTFSYQDSLFSGHLTPDVIDFKQYCQHICHVVFALHSVCSLIFKIYYFVRLQKTAFATRLCRMSKEIKDHIHKQYKIQQANVQSNFNTSEFSLAINHLH